MCGRLGILKGLGEVPPGVVGVATESGLRNGELSTVTNVDTLPFGGDWGGWTVTAGGCIGGGCGFAIVGGLVDGFGGGADSRSKLEVDGSATLLGRSLAQEAEDGVVGVLGEASCDDLKSRSLSGLGLGEIGLPGGCEGASWGLFGVSRGLFIFSNRLSSEETGF